MTTDLKPMHASNHLLGDEAALRQKFDEDGFLHFKQIVPHKALRALRRDITGILADEGWIKPGEDQGKAIAIRKPTREGDDAYFSAHDRLVKLESFHSLAHEPRLLSAMQVLLGEGAFPHPLSIMRLVFPNHGEATTPPHQDFPNNQGSKRLTAAWIPLSACPQEMGPLKILKGSHKLGVMPLKFHLGPGNRQADLSEAFDGLEWQATDFELGDIVVFGPLTVHSAMDNQDQDRMRLSVDFRYQPAGEPLTPICLQPHFERVSWEDIYANWQSDDLKYYWKDRDYKVVDYDDELHALSEEEEQAGLAKLMKYKIDQGELDPAIFKGLL